MLVGAAVFQQKRHLALLIVARRTHGPFQSDQITAGLGEIEIDRIELLDDGEQGGVALSDESAFRDLRPADAAGDRRGDGGVGEIELRGFLRGLGGQDFRGAHLQRGLGVFGFLLANSFGRDEFLEALGLAFGLFQIRFGTGEAGHRAVTGGLQRCGIDFEKQLSGFHVGTFLVGFF